MIRKRLVGTEIHLLTTTNEVCENVLAFCKYAVDETISNSSREETLLDLGMMASDLNRYVRRYEAIQNPHLSTDDEILNWVFEETHVDLCSAIWSLTSAFYKPSAYSLRSAMDVAVAALYFQIRENEDLNRSYYNKYYAEWDQGVRNTPSWGEMKVHIAKQKSVVRFVENENVNIVEMAYDHFKYLCGYTHTAAFANNKDPITAINTIGIAPQYDQKLFDRGVDLTRKTISLIAMLWQVVFPEIISTHPTGEVNQKSRSLLFPAPIGGLLLKHR